MSDNILVRPEDPPVTARRNRKGSTEYDEAWDSMKSNPGRFYRLPDVEVDTTGRTAQSVQNAGASRKPVSALRYRANADTDFRLRVRTAIDGDVDDDETVTVQRWVVAEPVDADGEPTEVDTDDEESDDLFD